MASADPDRILDFAPMGMWWQITRSTADTGGELFEAINVVAPGFPGPPLHLHPTALESYAVLSGTLDVCVGQQWQRLAAGESVTVPAGTPHTLKNGSDAELRLVNVHKPALGFERFFRRFHALISSGQMKLPPKDLRSAILISMLFSDRPQEIISVKPSRRLMKALALLGTLLRYTLPARRAGSLTTTLNVVRSSATAPVLVLACAGHFRAGRAAWGIVRSPFGPADRSRKKRENTPNTVGPALASVRRTV
jgi:quercetin dioxygenase-like cupin family protein